MSLKGVQHNIAAAGDPGLPPKLDAVPRGPDLLDTLAIVMISFGIALIVLWAATRILGLTYFDELPGWLVKGYSGIWTAGLTSTAGIGLAIAKHLQQRSSNINYFQYVGGTTVFLFMLIGIVAYALHAETVSRQRVTMTVPSEATQIDVRGLTKEFELLNPPVSPVIQYRLQGTYKLESGRLSIHMSSGRITLASFAGDTGPKKILRISFAVRYIYKAGRDDREGIFPNHPLPESSLDVDLPLKAGSTLNIPAHDFVIDVPPSTDLSRSWLFGQLWNEIAYMPAQ